MIIAAIVAAFVALAMMLTPESDPDPAPPAPPNPDGGTPSTPPAPDTEPTPEEGLTPEQQARFDKALKDRLARQDRKHQEELAAERAQRAELEKEREARRQADLTEEERKDEQRKQAEAERDAAKAEATAAKREALQTRLLYKLAPDLPEVYCAGIAGEDEEEITASINAAKERYAADNAGKLTAAQLAEARTMTPEERVAKFGDAGATLNELLKTPAQSVSGPSNLPGQPGVTLTATEVARKTRLIEIQKMTDPVERKRAMDEHIKSSYG